MGSVENVDITVPYINLILKGIKLGDRKIKVVYDFDGGGQHCGKYCKD